MKRNAPIAGGAAARNYYSKYMILNAFLTDLPWNFGASLALKGAEC